MTKNMNGNSNCNDEANAEDNQSHCVLEETREVVRTFLQRSLSQNAKSSMTFLKPEGYHKLKKEGKLGGHYHHRTSRSHEEGSQKNQPVLRRKSLAATPENSWSGGKTLSSLRELRNETNDHEHNRFKSELDVRTMQKLSESDSPEFLPGNSMVMQLLGTDSTVVDGRLQSLESLLSANDEEGSKTRRISFNKAVSGDSMLTDSDNKIDQPAENSEGRASDQMQTYGEKSRTEAKNLSPSLDDASHGGKPEKKFSFREKVKKIFPSNKRKLKLRRTTEVSRRDVTSDGPNKFDECRARSADPRIVTSFDQDFKRETEKNSQPLTASVIHCSGTESSKTLSFKRKTSPSSRTPSPTKSKSPLTTRKPFHLSFVHKKSSPKLKSRSFHQSSSSYSLSLSVPSTISEQMERNKSGSLPNSMRLAVNQSASSKPTNQRRVAEDASTSKAKLTHKQSKASDSNRRKSISQQDDFSVKKTKGSKLRRILRVFRKRHASESSTTSSRSLSLPSIPAAVDQDDEMPKADGISSSVSDETDGLRTTPSKDRYHHRGSMSLSSVNLDKLSDPEKQKVYEEIADSLGRLSTTFAKYMHKRSSQDSTTDRIDAFKSPSKPSSQRRGSKQESLFNSNEVSPSLSAYYNLSPRKRKDARLDKSAAVMPGSVPPRRVYHSKSKSLESHKDGRGHLLVPDIVLEEPTPDCGDVVDGFPPQKTGWMAQSDELQSDSADLRLRAEGSDVDTSQVATDVAQSREERPSTSTMVDRDGFALRAASEEYDEDKLVELLVNALRKKGDHIQESVDMPNGLPLPPAIGSSLLNTIMGVTYSKFQSVAARFCNNCRRLVERSPSRHPEIFSVVMVVNIAELVCNMATSETAAQAADLIWNYTTRYVTELVEERGNTWDEVLAQLHDTENEFNEVESPPREDRRFPDSNEELD